MKMGWITGTCGLTLGICVGYVAGNIAASAIKPLSFEIPTASLPITGVPVATDAPFAAEGCSILEAGQDDGAVFFPDAAIAAFPVSSTETVHAAGEIDATAGDDAPVAAPEPGELPESSDAAPLAESWDDLSLRRIIEHELADVPEADREVWVDALRGLPREDVVGILRLWRKFGGGGASMLPGTPEFGPGVEGDVFGSRPEIEDVSIPSPLVPEPPETETDATIAALLSARRIIINNLLNAETIGYRRREVLFCESGPGSDGASLLGTRIDHTQGRLVDTASLLDVGIEGPGFFVVSDGEQQLFTRCGRFSRGEDGRLVLNTSRGALAVQPEIVIPADMAWPLAILASDELTNNQSETVLPSIQLAQFADPGQLEPAGDGLFLATPASGPPQVGAPAALGATALRPMCLERSNVVIARERRQLRQIGEWLELVRSLAQE